MNLPVGGFFDGSAAAFIVLPLPVAAALLAAGVLTLLGVAARVARRRRDRQLDAIFKPHVRREWEPLPWHPGQDDAA